MKLSNALMGIALATTVGACTPKAPEKNPQEIENRTAELAKILKAEREESIELIRIMVRENCGEIISYDPEENAVTFGCQDSSEHKTQKVIFDEILPIKADE